MKLKLSSFFMLVAVTVLTSCGTGKKLKASEAQVEQLQNDVSACKTNLTNTTTASNAKIADLTGQVSSLTAQNAALAPDAAAYKMLKSDVKAQRAMLNASLAAQGTSLDEIRAKLVTGLSALADSGISVTLVNNLLFVSLPEKVLFKEGSATLSGKSNQALSALSSVLNNYPNVQIYVVGNTDSLKIHNAKFMDNWSLSTERANSIVRIFRDSYSVDPSRLMSAGRSKYSPIADNGTKEGRATNRRIQIILNPNLTGLWGAILQ